MDPLQVEKRFLASEVTLNESIDQEKRTLPESCPLIAGFIDLEHTEQTLPVYEDSTFQVEPMLPAVRC